MADFQTEGQGIMTGTVSVVWRIEPVSPPRPRRNCSTCGDSRLFRSSGKIRLNANGRRLDAWLIYKCDSCEKTWNLSLVERVAVTSIAERDLRAMHGSDPAWVREREFDLATLGRYCDRIDIPPDLTVTKIVEGDLAGAWSVIELAINVQRRTGQRLDRLLARELKLTRSELQSMQRAGGLQFDSGSGRIMRKPIRGSVTLRFVSSGLTESQRAAVSDNVSDRRQDLLP
ncbi:DUF1062 domain-containing protein [Paenirhodobacter populi]|uniref:DUF1062 domain-containing protein n=1 Tax=Paenirhodobacter populi TaxID=2306993 RepID=A0A443J8Q2_9RHOB|nr:DUF1062 domain-containing protein [Sinirhodobacter populi]RWR04324.1 DUF1062 domain-containing protein [Sinirhodobacter populi]RWR16877.1 DUF1062 domain-containing protein [Sinirhodobacter populi]